MLPWILLAATCSRSVISTSCKHFDASQLHAHRPEDYCSLKMDKGSPPRVGDMCMANPAVLHPTQVSIGKVAAACKQRKIEMKAKKEVGKLRHYLMRHPAPAVIGPNGSLYITDHHHLSYALLSAFLPFEKSRHDRAMYVCVTDDLSNLTETAFWSEMKRRELVWLTDEKGSSITPQDLPPSVKTLRDDPYRTLAALTRKAHGFVKCDDDSNGDEFPQCKGGKVAKPFIEFRWANIYRKKFRWRLLYAESYQEQTLAFKKDFEEVIKYSLDKQNRAVEGWNQRQITALVTIDEHGCVAKRTQPQVLLM